MKVLVVLLLAVFTSCNANHPRQQADVVKDVFWDYVARATATAEESLKKIRESELTQEMNTFITRSTDAVNMFTDTLHTQVAPLTQDLMSKVSQEAEQLKTRLEKDLMAVRTRLQPYTELMADLLSKVEKLKKDAAPYAEVIDPQSLKAVLQQKSQELEQRVNWLQEEMEPYTDEIKNEFWRNFSEKAQMTQGIQQSLAPYTEELMAKLDVHTQSMKEQLASLWKTFTKLTQ